jgi:hypothetical protein
MGASRSSEDGKNSKIKRVGYTHKLQQYISKNKDPTSYENRKAIDLVNLSSEPICNPFHPL